MAGPSQDWSEEVEAAERHHVSKPIERLVSEAHVLYEEGEPGLRCPLEYAMYEEESSSSIEFGNTIKVVREGDVLKWSYTPPKSWQEMGSSVVDVAEDDSLVITEAYKFRHEQVCKAVSPLATDMRLSCIQVLDDHTDTFTPDFIIRDENDNVHVIEVTTLDCNLQNRVKSAFEAKIARYQEDLIRRSMDKCITFTVVVVTPDRVFCNVPLDNDMTRNLILRMRRALAIERVMLQLGQDIKLGEQLTTRQKLSARIKMTIESIQEYKYEGREEAVFLDKDFRNRCVDDTTLEDKLESGRIFKKCFKTAEELKKVAPNHLQMKADFKRSLEEVKPKNLGMKPVCIIPLVSPRVSSDDSPRNITVRPDTNQDYLNKIWGHASSVTRKSESDKDAISRLKKEATTTDNNLRMKLEATRASTMKKKNRVSMTPVLKQRSVLEKLNADGVMAKKKKDSDLMKTRRQQQKSYFDLESHFEDIEKWMDSKMMFTNEPGPEYPGLEPVIRLLTKSNNMQNNPSTGLDVVREWSNTKLGRSQLFISDLAAELTISMKQYCEKDDFILKKLSHFDVWVLIRTSGQDNHVFFSLYIHDCDVTAVQLPFRNLHKGQNGYYTDFVSVKKSKITNMLIAFPRLLTLASFWGDFYGLPRSSPLEFYNHKEARAMLNFTVLLSLENKAQTEEIITQTRYMYMEIFKSNTSMVSPNPFKVLSKMPVLLRSRLAAFLLKRVLENFHKMLVVLPTRNTKRAREAVKVGDESAPGDQWRGLLNFITGDPVSSATSVVNLFYLGYLKDKNETGEKNSEWGLVEKIVEEELKYSNERRAEAYGGKTDLHKKVKGKSFSLSCMKHGASKMQARLKNMFGPTWKNIVTSDIIDALTSQTTESIASLKASARIDHSDCNGVTSLDDAEKTVRVKVIEAVASKMACLQENPFLSLPQIIKSVEETTKGVVCDLFKKAQHGGLREIYVLTIESRILQLYIETISRTLCSYFEEETLTHPENKLRLLDRHKVRSSQIASSKNSVSGDFCNSSDKTRWNQNFLMTNMAVCLYSLTDDMFHCSITRILNLWANKLIKMPPGVLSVLMKGKMLSSETFAELSNQYHTGKAKDGKLFVLNKRCSPFLKLTTGMMQGILHYTSSLQHISLLCSSRYWIKAFLKAKYEKAGFTFSMTNVCSSDDSATILSFFPSSGVTKFGALEINVIETCHTAMSSMTLYCEFYSMVESTKSTIGVFDYVEFNSEFIFKNTIAVPTIKSVAACLNLTESESFVRRFYEQYNLLSALESSGFPHYNGHLCQLAQAILHYHSMGSGTSPLFPDWAEDIIEFPDPVHGFFLMDSILAPGIMGMGYCIWNALQCHDSLRVGFTGEKGNEVSMSPDGVVTKSLKIKFGDNKRWGKMMYRIMNKTLDSPSLDLNFGRKQLKPILNKIEEDPEPLFRPAKTMEEAHTKLLCRAMGSGVAESLGKGNPTYNAYSSSVYILFSSSFTKVSLIENAIKEELPEKKAEKISLWRSLLDEKHRAQLLQEREEEENMQEQQRVLEEMEEKEREAAAKRRDPRIPGPRWLRETIVPASEQLVSERNKSRIDEIHFPLVERYKEARRIFNEYAEAKPIETHILRQRKSTVLIQSSNMNMPITIRQAVAFKWFQIPLHLSRGTINRCWSQYLLTYPWLRDGWKESLLASPFLNFLDLYNFVSGVTNSSRKLHRVGPSIGTGSFTSQLHNLIRMGYLRNRRLVLDDGQRAEQRDVKGSRLISSLSLALHLPYLPEKIKYVKPCLSQILDHYGSDPSVIVGMNYTTFSAWVMAWVQGRIDDAKEKNRELDITGLTDMIRSKSFGLRMGYLAQQTRHVDDNGRVRWTGRGTALCSCGGLNVKVEMDGEFITRIYCNNTDALRRDPGLLMNIFFKLSSIARNDMSQDPPEGTMYKFTGTTFVASHYSGVPVVYQPRLEAWDEDFVGVDLKYGQGSIDLMLNMGLRKVSILTHRYNTKFLDLDPEPDFIPTVSTAMSECWVKSSSVNRKQAESLLKKLTDKKVQLDEKDMAYKPWIAMTISKRLKYLGLLPNSDVVASEVGTAVFDDQDLDLVSDMEFLVGAGPEAHHSGSDEEDAEPCEEAGSGGVQGEGQEEELDWLEDLLGEDIDAMADAEENDEPVFESMWKGLLPLKEDVTSAEGILDMQDDMDLLRVDLPDELLEVIRTAEENEGMAASLLPRPFEENFYMRHPLWDEWINSLRGMSSGFFANTLNGIVDGSQVDTSVSLMALLNIRQQSGAVNLRTEALDVYPRL
ncbi:MAG: RNA-dependent RNA polymerase [Sanya nilaparvata lugens phenuivirus 1]|nr:MAG: RNA-dependent RNA polymerase [Sanya nilaparvata lugens phenuivirus 1]